MKYNKYYSTNLFNYPSFSKGMARIWDLFGNLDAYQYSKTDDEADYRALSHDWQMTGYLIQNALKKYESVNG